MRLDELMGSLQTFELNLKQNKKKKSIALRAEEQESDDEGNSNDDKFFDLLTKNFNKFLKKMSRRKSTQNSTRINNFPKNKKAVSTSELKKQNKGIQCRECEGFGGHIQSECANTLKKKGKSFKTT